MISNNIKFKKQISESMNLSGLTAAQQNKIISGLTDNISARIGIAILDQLNEKEKKELQNISKSKKKDAVLNYLNSKIENLPLLIGRVIKETINEFKRIKND